MATYNDIKKIKIGDNTFVFHVPTASEVGALSDSTTIPAITLNGTANTSPSFYAPTTAGTNGYVLKSNGSGAPTWTSATLTDTKVTTAALTSGTLYYPILATGTGTATRQIDSTLKGLTYKSTAGTASTVGEALLTLGNNIASGTANNEKGVFRIYGTGATYYTDLVSGTPTANRTITLPNKTGTVALTSDVTDSKVTVEDAINNQIYYPILATGTGTATRQVDITGEFKYGRTAEYTSDGVTHPGKASLVLGNLNGLGNGKRIGAISLAGTNQFYSTILSTTLTTDRTITLPNKDGTIALTSDITDAAEIFWATYGTTTKAELDAASAAGKLILLGDPNNYTEILYGNTSSGYVFEKVDTFGWTSSSGMLSFEDYVYYIENDNDGWQTQLNYFNALDARNFQYIGDAPDVNTATNNVLIGDISYNVASGGWALATGSNTTAGGSCSTAMGSHTIANGNNQLVIGKYNIADTNNDSAFIIGNGENQNTRSNTFTVNWKGQVDSYLKPTSNFDWDTDTANHNPASSQYYSNFEIINANNNIAGNFGIHKYTDGVMAAVVGAHRVVNDNDVYNSIYLRIADDGTKSYGVDDPGAFKQAIGLADGTINATNNTSYITSGTISCRRKGGCVTVTLRGIAVKQLTARTAIATIPEGYRPSGEQYGTINGEGSSYFIVTTAGALQMNAGSARTVYGQITYAL